MDDSRTLTIAAGLGALAGLRSFSAPLAVARAARANHVNLSGSPLFTLGSSRGANVIAALALGELIADKTPFIPNRTDTPSLIARFVSGAIAGASIAKARNGKWLAAAVVAGAAAAGATFAAYEVRRRLGQFTGIPDPIVALIEDAVAIGSGLALVNALKR